MTALLDHGYLKYVEHWGSDERIVEAARMSTGKGFLGWEPGPCPICDGSPQEPPCYGCEGKGTIPGDKKLLRTLFCSKPQHSTPFEMGGMVVEVSAPIMVYREWHRHRTQCLAGDTMIVCVTPNGTTYQRSVRAICELKHGGVIDTAPARHQNGYSRAGTTVTREARRKDPWRTRVLPNCQGRTLRVCDESTGEFTTARMADVWESGVKEVFLLETENGHGVRASAEHPFLTPDGWVKLKDVAPGVRVARMGKVASSEPPIPPALRRGIGVWTSMMRGRLIGEEARCYLCGVVFPASGLILDHVVPVSRNLLTALDVGNLRPACLACSRRKTDTEQPDRNGQTRRGVRWEKVKGRPIRTGEEETFDVEVEGPHHNYIANSLIVHNSYNEMSGRYVALPNTNYIPSVERLLIGSDGKNKQAGTIKGAGVLAEEDAEEYRTELAAMWKAEEEFYQKWLKRGVPKELARAHIGVGRYSRMRASANLLNWLKFLILRMDMKAQWEIQQYARAVAEILRDKFPRTMELFDAEKH